MGTKSKQESLPVKFNYEIVDGPSRETLFDALKYAYDDNVVISATFTVAPQEWNLPNQEPRPIFPAKTKSWRITHISHEDGSGYSFNIEGYCKANLRRHVTTYEGRTGYLMYRFKSYYNCRTRKGRIELTEC